MQSRFPKLSSKLAEKRKNALKEEGSNSTLNMADSRDSRPGTRYLLANRK
jgi:hypothetical protein